MLSLHFLNVGRGDCTIIELKTHDVHAFGLVDCNRTITRHSPAKDKLIQLGAKKLAFVCVTHPDSDHYTGILDVLEYFEVEQFITYPILNSLSSKSLFKKLLIQYKEFAKGQDNSQISKSIVELIKILLHAEKNFLKQGNWNEVTGYYNEQAIAGFPGIGFFGVMPPAAVKGRFSQALNQGQVGATFNNNDLSAGLLVQYAGQQILLAADVPGANWDTYKKIQRRLSSKIQSSICKIPHHGSKHDCNDSFVELVFGKNENSSTKLGIISANGTTHPHKEAFQKLHNSGVVTMCTNMAPFHFNAAHRLITDNQLSPEFLSTLNLYAEPASRQSSQPCRGDITVTIDQNGHINTTSQYDPLCACSALFDKLANSQLNIIQP
jgi:beta-lactamase superfamily II metal-dependent hydrolase